MSEGQCVPPRFSRNYERWLLCLLLLHTCRENAFGSPTSPPGADSVAQPAKRMAAVKSTLERIGHSNPYELRSIRRDVSVHTS
jgi:hypothetical protein